MMNIYEEAKRCLLCEDAPCTKACGKGDPARAIRAIRFDNTKNAMRWIKDCSDEDLERAESACIHYDNRLRIKGIIRGACCDYAGAFVRSEMPEEAPLSAASSRLAITFCGILCENPFFLASSAVCTNYEMVAHAFEAGWAGVFYKTVCMQEIREVSPRFDAIKEGTSFAGFRNMEQLSEHPCKEDFDIMRRLKQNFPGKVVIASIMGQTGDEWIELAKMAEEAGCDAVELNFSCPQMHVAGMGSDVGQDAELVTFYTAYVKRHVKIPVIPKMTPNVSRMDVPAMGCYFAGADAISAINTIKSVTMSPAAQVSEKNTISGYSGRAVKPIALRFILEMTKHPFVGKLQFSGIGGIETWRDALEFMQLGCRNVQVCTAVMQYGYRIIDDLLLGLETYLEERGIEHLEDIVGEKLPSFVLPSEMDCDTVVYPKFDHSKCIGCGRCYRSCMDGGHQAISFEKEKRLPHLIGAKCVGCHLCRLVCPTDAIGSANRVVKRW